MTQGTISSAPIRLSGSLSAAPAEPVRRASPSPLPDSLRSYIPFIGKIFAVAMALRCLVALLAYWNRNIAGILWPRGIEMLGVAKSLATGNGFSSPFPIPTGPTAFVPPIYPSILSVILRIFGDHTNASAWAILLLQCFVSALTVAPIFALALDSFGRREAKAAAWLWALFPYAIILPTNIIWESSLSAFVVAVGAWLLLRAWRSRGTSRWLYATIWWAAGCLLNAALLLLLPAAAFYSFLRKKIPFATLAACAAAFIAVLAPWSIRNYLVMGRAVPLRDNFALEMWIGNHSGTAFRFTPEIHPAFNAADLRHYQQIGELAYMDEKGAEARAFIRANPGQFAVNTLERIARFWLIGRNGLIYLVAPLAILGIVGLCVALRRAVPA
ncbi:MAG TPA: glycosyltransferase family 39 protein, partial [Candidatus Acidoferrales bacterium]|nr:glycosyltransferase family 39 protein [Candidatus Acidoferrales bacterium]